MKVSPTRTVADTPSALPLRTDGGQIWLGDQRMVLMHAHVLGALRKELANTLGLDQTRGILTRMGYAAGAQDAESFRQTHADMEITELLKIGPRLHGIEGVADVTTIRLEADAAKQQYYGEFEWRSSFEDRTHTDIFGPSDHPACWTQLGYACGFATKMMDAHFILFKEVECAAQGHSCCRIVGQPVAAWQDQEETTRAMRYFQPESITDDLLSLQDQLQHLESAIGDSVTLGDMIGASLPYRKACDLILKAAVTDVTVLLLGETGVGKEMFARALHSESKRSEGPFVAVNCAAIPDSLIESELFGVDEGAYTGASRSRTGRIERANGGTLFLDEIGDMSADAQAKLLRVLQEKEVERVGGSRTRSVDVRVVAATNVGLEDAMKAGTFRQDLFYRLNIFPVPIPALRCRREDISLLTEVLLNKLSVRHGKRIRGITPTALQALQAYDWPGNIRELENVLERAIILTPDDKFLAIDLFPNVNSALCSPRLLAEKFLDCETTLEDFEQQLFEAAVARSDGNLNAAARLLGVTRRQVAYKLEKASEAS